jgi:SET domain-containing protein
MEKKSPRVKVKRSKAGLGLYALEDIPKGQFIIEYIGEVISNDEADRRLGRYLFELNKKQTLDGSSRKNIARYINHSCRPNCEVDIKKGKVLISARKKIQAGEELNYDYGKEYFNGFIKPFGCRCEKCTEQRKAKRAAARKAKK